MFRLDSLKLKSREDREREREIPRKLHGHVHSKTCVVTFSIQTLISSALESHPTFYPLIKHFSLSRL